MAKTERAAAGAPIERPSADAAGPGLLRSLLRTARPKQWTKNVLILSAPAAAGVLDEGHQIWRVALAIVSFCLAASGTYFFNDALDVHADRSHPTKRFRPIAAGHVGETPAKIIAALLVLGGLAVAAPVNHGKLLLVVGSYAVIQLAYNLWLKHEPVLDLAAVASGFVLRAIAGGVAADVKISDWFLIVAGGASLFIVTGKRHAEQVELGTESRHHRRTLGEYSYAFLGQVRTIAASVTILAYCLWAFESANAIGNVTLFRFSIIPFVLAILRYALVVEQGRGGAPEEVILADRELQLLGVAWALLFALGVYAS